MDNRKNKKQKYQFNEHDSNQVEGIRRKRKVVRLKKQVKIFLFLLFFTLFGLYLSSEFSQVKTIVVKGNDLLDTQEIINSLNIDETSRHLLLIPMFLEAKLEQQPLIENATITKGLFNTLYITVEEIVVVSYISENNQTRVIDSRGNISNITTNVEEKIIRIQNNPRVKGFSDEEMLQKFASEFIKLNESIRTQISDITYDPTDILKTRIRFDMRDGTIVYIKIEYLESSFNSYNDVKASYNDKCTIFDFAKKKIYASGEGCDYQSTSE